jgi:hypothetical protein
MEATKCLKPSDNGHEFGDRASVQAAERVNDFETAGGNRGKFPGRGESKPEKCDSSYE